MSDERQNRPTFVSVVELPDKISRQNRWTHGRYFCLLLHTLSASTRAECKSQNNTCITFFLHL